MKINPKHPRAESLAIREKLLRGISMGITSYSGLMAHGRGEAFDYLLGETTHNFARTAIEAACATLILAEKPILSVNGNSAALCPQEFIQLSLAIPCKIEINLFHYSPEREKKIEQFLRKQSLHGDLLISSGTRVNLSHVASKRKKIYKEGDNY